MKIALAQINPTVGDFTGNLEKIIATTKRAAERGARLAVFSELAICGYPPADFLEKPSFLARCRQAVSELAAATRDLPTALVAGVALPARPDAGKPAVNSAVLLDSGQVLLEQHKRNPEFSPAHPTILNPAVDTSEGYGAPHATRIENNHTRRVANLFDALYSLMLRMLGYTFTPCGSSELRQLLGQSAIVLMATVLKPLGETLTSLPATDKPDGPTAGPPFGLTRHVTLPVDAASARTLVTERLQELTTMASEIASDPAAPDSMARIETTLVRVRDMVEALPARAAGT